MHQSKKELQLKQWNQKLSFDLNNKIESEDLKYEVTQEATELNVNNKNSLLR